LRKDRQTKQKKTWAQIGSCDGLGAHPAPKRAANASGSLAEMGAFGSSPGLLTAEHSGLAWGVTASAAPFGQKVAACGAAALLVLACGSSSGW
jgi:hypothetical protein